MDRSLRGGAGAFARRCAVRCVRDDGAVTVRCTTLALSRFSVNSAESIKAIVHARLRQPGSSPPRSVLRSSCSDFHIFGGGRSPHSPLVLVSAADHRHVGDQGRHRRLVRKVLPRPRTASAASCPPPSPPPPSPPTQPPIFSIRGWSWGSHGALCVASSAHFLFSRGCDRRQPALHHHRGGGRRRLPQHGGARRRLRRPALRRHGQGRAGPLRSARAAFCGGQVLADRPCDPPAEL